MKNLYYKRIYMDMGDGQSVQNWGTQIVYCPEEPKDTLEEIRYEKLIAGISNGYINGTIYYKLFKSNQVKYIAIDNMQFWNAQKYDPNKINYPIYRITKYSPLDHTISFKELSEELSAEDFIRWMKDNEMNTCPIMK